MTIGLFGNPVVANSTTASYRYGPSNGYGSTNTAIRKYTGTLVASVDPTGLLTVANDAANGFSVTAAKACVVTISATDTSTDDGSRFGISLNSNQLTTSYVSINSANKLALAQIPQANYSAIASVTIPLAVGDVLRVHGDASAPSSTNVAMVTVTAVSI